MELHLLTLEDMVERFGVDPKTIYNWRRHKGLPYVKIGKQIYFRVGSVNDWLTTREKRTEELM